MFGTFPLFFCLSNFSLGHVFQWLLRPFRATAERTYELNHLPVLVSVSQYVLNDGCSCKVWHARPWAVVGTALIASLRLGPEPASWPGFAPSPQGCMPLWVKSQSFQWKKLSKACSSCLLLVVSVGGVDRCLSPKPEWDLKLLSHCPSAADKFMFLAVTYGSLKPTRTRQERLCRKSCWDFAVT